MYWKIEFKEGIESWSNCMPAITDAENYEALKYAKILLEDGWAHVRDGIPFSVTMQLIDSETLAEEVRDE